MAKKRRTKRKYQFQPVYCLLQNKGYTLCNNRPQDCRKCPRAMAFEENLTEDRKVNEAIRQNHPELARFLPQ